MSARAAEGAVGAGEVAVALTPSIHLVTREAAVEGLVADVARALGWQLWLTEDVAHVAAGTPTPAGAAAGAGGGAGGQLVVIDRQGQASLEGLGALKERLPHCEVVLFADGPAQNVLADLQRWDIATFFSYPPGDAQHLSHVLKGAMDKARLRQEHFRLQESLRHRSLHDDLTGLANGALLTLSLERIAHQARGRPEFLFAVMHLDIDRFKNINDSLGHQEGDNLICQVAARLVAGVRPGDTVARIGGDEFTVLLGGIHDAKEAMLIADRIQQSFTEPLPLGGEDIFVTASIGVAISRQSDTDPRHLLRDADLAMYRAKARGTGHIELFDTSMHTRAVELLGLENSLRRALTKGELLLHYQPVVRLRDGTIAGFEALVRWQSPERGTVSPGEFIPLAEETGLIVPIGAWVLSEACRQLAAWKARPQRAHLFMSVNVSARQFSQPRLVEHIAQVLQETGVAASDLKLEITESLVIDNVESTVVMLHRLQNMNVRLCVDDFGTGYSSLSQLYQLPIHTLKIDRAFVSRLKDSHSHAEIVDTIIMLAHNLGMDVIAEGVETREQVAALRDKRCELGQGFFFAQPMPAAAAEALLGAQPAWQRA